MKIKFLPSVRFEPTTYRIRGKRLTARRRGPHGRERTTPRLKLYKICFSQFTLFYRVECEKLFCKTNIKLKVLKLIKTK